MSIKGGCAALGGFLYQMIGVLGLKVWAEINSGDSNAPEDISKLLKIVQKGELQHEKFDSDAFIRNFVPGQKDGCCLVQFKYSGLSQPAEIYEQELQKIAKSMYISAAMAQKHGQQVMKYFLITNRRLADSAEFFLETVQNSRTTNPQKKILRQLKRIQKLEKHQFEAPLIKYGKSFGLFPPEIENGIDKLVGRLMRSVTDGINCPLSLQDIKKAFTGTGDAMPLISSSVRNVNQSKFERQVKEWISTKWDELIRRSFLEEVQAKAFERALVIICGEGGCGKTAILGQWAHEKLNDLSSSNNAFTCLIRAFGVNHTCIVDTIRGWGNFTNTLISENSSPEYTLKRIENANPKIAPPIFHLGLDGIDEKEDFDYKKCITKILQWFWEQDISAQHKGTRPIATLLVTCRKKEIIYNLLRHGDGFSDDEDSFSIVEVGDFSDEEFLDAVKKSIPEMFPKVANLLQSNEHDLQTLGGPFSSGFGPGFQYSADPEVIKALKHPIIWRSFLELDQENRARALKKENEALRAISKIFIRWCVTKTHYRLEWLPEIHIQEIFQSIAQGGARQGTAPYTVNNFTQYAQETDLVNPNQAKALYNEALVSGLIREDANLQWRWRHEFVRKYLADQGNKARLR